MISYGLKRLIAFLIDYGLYIAFVYTYVIFFGEQTSPGNFQVMGLRHLLALFFAWLIYFPVLESILGYTLGKGAFDLKVVDLANGKATFSKTLKRHLLDPIDFLVFGFIAVFTVRRTAQVPRRLGDLWAGTLVVDDKD